MPPKRAKKRVRCGCVVCAWTFTSERTERDQRQRQRTDEPMPEREEAMPLLEGEQGSSPDASEEDADETMPALQEGQGHAVEGTEAGASGSKSDLDQAAGVHAAGSPASPNPYTADAFGDSDNDNDVPGTS